MGRKKSALPAHVVGTGTFGIVRGYTHAAISENTLKAYAKDWEHLARWCRMEGAVPVPPSPEVVWLYPADLTSGSPVGYRRARPMRE